MADNPDEPFNESKAEVFDALGHPTRIKILQVLSEKPFGFSELKIGAGIESNGLLSFHLGKLAGLVKVNPEGSYALTEEGREALRIVEASRKPSQEAPVQRPSVHMPHLKTILVALVVVLVILAAASAIEYNQIQALDSRTQSTPPTITDTATVTSSITTTTTNTATITSTTTVTDIVTNTPPGPTLYKADQVVPIDLDFASAPGASSTITPSSLRLVVGVNNSVLFVNSGKSFAAVDSISWPANSTGFETPIMSPGQNYTIILSAPGLYNYTRYIHPDGTFGSILVVDVPNISASTDSSNTITLTNLSLCASGCPANQTFSAGVLVGGANPITSLVLYLNGTSEGLSVVNNMTNYTYLYSANLVDSYIPMVRGDTYFVELVAIFANDQLAVATASIVAT